MRVIIWSGGLLFGGLVLGVCLVAWQQTPIIWLLSIPAGIVSGTLIAIVLHWPAVQHERQIHLTEIERQKTSAYHLAQERIPQAQREPLSVDAEAERHYRWHRFWAQCLQYAAENGDTFSWRNCFERILPEHSDWRYLFAGPLVKAGWLEPVQASIKTKPMPGWTATRMLTELSAGTPPPYPNGEPPSWKQTGAENTQKHSENTSTVFATDIGSRRD